MYPRGQLQGRTLDNRVLIQGMPADGLVPIHYNSSSAGTGGTHGDRETVEA